MRRIRDIGCATPTRWMVEHQEPYHIRSAFVKQVGRKGDTMKAMLKRTRLAALLALIFTLVITGVASASVMLNAQFDSGSLSPFTPQAQGSGLNPVVVS